jgi:hypothetical protein
MARPHLALAVTDASWKLPDQRWDNADKYHSGWCLEMVLPSCLRHELTHYMRNWSVRAPTTVQLAKWASCGLDDCSSTLFGLWHSPASHPTVTKGLFSMQWLNLTTRLHPVLRATPANCTHAMSSCCINDKLTPSSKVSWKYICITTDFLKFWEPHWSWCLFTVDTNSLLQT